MPRISLSASVALTAPGARNLNRLRPSSFAVTDLRVTTPGGPMSRCHRPAPLPPSSTGGDDFHFVPEMEDVELTYAVDDASGRVVGARLELFTRHRKAPLWTRELSPEERADGEHRLRWDGRVSPCEDFPDGVVTVEHSPYKLKLTLSGTGWAECPVAWTYFHVLVDGIELESGSPEVLAQAKDRDVLAALGHLPPTGEKAEVRLASNLFKTSSREMEDATSFTQYQAAWNDGPRIPLFARAWLRDSRDRRVDAPKALGRVRFLWDWEDAEEDLTRHTPRARAFLERALDRHRAGSKPKGDNAHVEVGGKRGLPSAAVFPKQAGYAPRDALKQGVFPFRVTPCRSRNWAAFSLPWTSGVLAGRTGVLFQPSRIAGDAWRVTVQLAYDRRKDGGAVLDVEDDAPLPAAVRASTGTFETWREVTLARLVRKAPGVIDCSLDTVREQYTRAHVHLEDRSGGRVDLDATRYNASIATVVRTQPWDVQAAIDPAVDQYAAGGHALTFRDHDDFLAEVRRVKRCDDAGLAHWLSPPGRRAPPLLTPLDYHRACKDWAKQILIRVLDGELGGRTQGIVLFQFAGLYNHEAAVGGVKLNGFALDLPSGRRDRCAVVQCAVASNYGGNSNTLEQTIAHEIGHHLFLPHAPFPVSSRIGGMKAADHDQDGRDCLMGYDFSLERRFCGLCLLRLRGWDQRALSSDGARNAKP